MSNVKEYKVTCPHDCPDSCSMLVSVDQRTGRAINVKGDNTHPVTRGYLCGKVNNYLELVYSEQRVLYPHKRIGERGNSAKFVRISWDEAIEIITNRFRMIINQYGPEAIQPFSYSGTLGLLNFEGMSERFWNKMGASRLSRTICTAAGKMAATMTTGQVGEADIEKIPDMEYVILWATNLVSTGVHAIPFIEQAKENGAKIVAIDPRVTRTTSWADWHLQPLPGTDAALALGMIKVIYDNNLHNLEFIESNTIGWNRLLEEKLPKYTLDYVSSVTGLAPSDIEKLAIEYGSTKKSFIRLNWGIQRHDNGGMMVRSIYTLPAITGSYESGGGICLGTAQEMRNINTQKLQRPDLLQGKKPREINMIQIGKALNDESMSPQIKALYCWNSDIINCVPDSASVKKGLMREDLFTVVHDTFFTDSTKYADIVLPADTCLERTDIHGAYGNFYFSLSNQAIDKLGESLDNQETFRRLAKAMGYTEECFNETDEEIIRDILDDSDNALLDGITFNTLKNNGWCKAAVDSKKRLGINSKKWATKSGKIEIYSSTLEEQGMDPLPDHIQEKVGISNEYSNMKYPLQVISAATHYFVGASFQPAKRLRQMMSRQCFELNECDAKIRNIRNGDYCRLYNDLGETFGHARIVPGLLEGIIGTQKQLSGSSMRGGFNVNVLCGQDVADFGGSPVYYSVLAEIEKFDVH